MTSLLLEHYITLSYGCKRTHESHTTSPLNKPSTVDKLKNFTF